MEANSILSANILDIIFDARNKEYGAYDLRKNYQRRLTKAVLSMLLIVVLLLVAYLLMAAIKPSSKGKIEVTEYNLEDVKEKQKIDPPVVPPPVKQPVIEIKTKMFTNFKITPDDKVPDNEKPPEQTDLTDAKIGTANIDGKLDDGILGPPVEQSKGIVEAPKKQDEGEVIFTKVEIESKYPGGPSAWGSFLNHNLSYPQEAADIAVQGTVMIQFIVDTEGTVSDVTAISGPEELRKAAVTVIKKSGRWDPAIQNGRKVKSYKKQPVTFKLED